ncbi:MAG TPA: hypothetical protein PLO33_02435, partial [Kouleothrix sp.]|nr:hypothetical protein [Kouleothrix sp.]
MRDQQRRADRQQRVEPLAEPCRLMRARSGELRLKLGYALFERARAPLPRIPAQENANTPAAGFVRRCGVRHVVDPQPIVVGSIRDFSHNYATLLSGLYRRRKGTPMARRKRQNPFLSMAQVYLNQHMPDMSGARLQLRMLDGPPGSPRYAVTAEVCRHICPYGVLPAQAALGKCTVFDCP